MMATPLHKRIKNFWVVAFVFSFFSCSDPYTLQEHQQINKGVLDLSSPESLKSSPIRLMGDVEFYWMRLLSPTDIPKEKSTAKPSYTKIPGVWNGYNLNGKILDGNGYATFRFTILTPEEGIYGLKINEIDCAYKIWANSVIDSVGRVAPTKSAMNPSWERRVLLVNSINKKIEIVFQVSNFQHRKGGPEDAMVFGTASQIVKVKQKLVSIDWFLLSVFLLAGIFHLSIYSMRRNDKSILLFFLLCLAMALRLMTSSEKLIYAIFPHIPWGFEVRLEYFAYTITIPLMLAFLQSYFPWKQSSRIVRFFLWVSILFTLSYIITPVSFFTHTPKLFFPLMVLAGIYIFNILIRALKQKEENALIFFISFLIFFITGINDILNYFKLINTFFMLPMGLAFMIISQSYALIKHQTKTFTENERLSSELDRYNHELEIIVGERTVEVLHQKEELEAQADKLKEINDRLVELSRFKDSMMGMAVHDMKNHLHNIILLSNPEYNNEIDFFNQDRVIYQSAIQLQALVMNILDTQRLEETRFVLNIGDVDLFPIVEQVKKELAMISDIKGIAIINKINEETFASADAELIHRVFLNLVSNAIKYSPSNSEVTITEDRQAAHLLIRVIDNGYGIPSSFKEKIFSKFSTYSHPSTEGGKSTGLGLSFCKLAIETLSGSIGMVPNTPKGSIFWFTIPAGDSGNTH